MGSNASTFFRNEAIARIERQASLVRCAWGRPRTRPFRGGAGANGAYPTANCRKPLIGTGISERACAKKRHLAPKCAGANAISSFTNCRKQLIGKDISNWTRAKSAI
jgi:hypothetical protein